MSDTETTTEDDRIWQARKSLADTETTPGDYGNAYAQRTELRIALELLLEVVDEQHATGLPDIAAMERYRNSLEMIRRPVRRP